MKNIIKKIGLLLTILMFLQCGEEGTIGLVEYGDLTGRVVKKEGFEPLENVKISLSPSSNTVFTDVDGYFKFEKIEVQDYSVKAEKEGYLSKFEGVTLADGVAVNVVLEMEISTASNKPPTKPELLSPDDGTTGLQNTVELSWEATDPDEDELLYTIEIRNDFNEEVVVINDLIEKQYTLSELKYGAKYFWSVTVSDGINDQVVSSLRSFTVKSDTGNRYLYVQSVEGNHVIFSSNYDEATNEINNTVQLTSSTSNSWRPRKNNTSNLIAFLKNVNNQAHIFTMNTNGSEVKKVTSSVPVAGFNLNELDFSWSPNGDKLIYPYFDKLYSINKDGSGLQEVYQTADSSWISECDWSSDGSKIAIKTNNANGYNGAIMVIDVNGNVLDTVVSNVQGALGGVNLSVSGGKILFTRDVSDYQATNYRQLDTRMFIYDFSSATLKDVSLDTEKQAGKNDLDPRFSPSEAEIIFVNTSNDGISVRNIMRLSIDDTTSRKILFSDATMPDWE